MVRSSEYTWRRRIAMQAVLCLTLALTLLLAWWVSRSRAAAWAVKLGEPEPFANKIMNLEVRLPIGWDAMPYIDSSKSRLKVVEPQTNENPQRILIIDVRNEPAVKGQAPDPQDVASVLMGERSPGTPTKFEFLGHLGVILEYPAKAGEKVRPMLCACTIIPGAKPVAVTLELRLEAMRPFQPADYQLLKSIAKSLTPGNPIEPVDPPASERDPDRQ